MDACLGALPPAGPGQRPGLTLNALALGRRRRYAGAMAVDDTIFAVASGAGRAAVAVLRMSGPLCGEAVCRLTSRAPPPPRRASLRALRDHNGALLDEALVLWMPGPASYTGEDTAEFQLHAGPAVLDGVAAALVAVGARPAAAGEFTRRAFLNGRMSLTQAEAVADLIAAETKAQRVQALRQMEGALGRLFEDWARRLRQLLAGQEAMIDFPDDTQEAAPDHADVIALRHEIEAELADDRRGERLREGLFFVVSGPPNVGKSSLINVLIGRDAAIVAPSPGTTRDVLEVRAVFGGVPVLLQDTAGLRETEDLVEAEGVRRARARAAEADLVLSLAEASAWTEPPSGASHILPIASKIDLAPTPPGTIGVSATTGAGLAALRARLDVEAHRLTAAGGPPPLTRARHRVACLRAVAHLAAAEQILPAELRAEELRLAMLALGEVTGRVGVEDVLDSVFSQFCIGK
jgi:tRNA modification GTPase